MNRENVAEVMRHLEIMNKKIDCVVTVAKKNSEELHRIAPQQTLQPVPRPKQGYQVGRGTNVAKYMRQYVKEKNATATGNQPRFKEFSDEIDDKQYNTDAMNCLEWILGFHLGTDLGILTWDQVCKRNPDKMGAIIKDSMNAPELSLFAQAAGQWAIQTLITNKMNSRIRYNREHMSGPEEVNEQQRLAPTTVPDIDETDPTYATRGGTRAPERISAGTESTLDIRHGRDRIEPVYVENDQYVQIGSTRNGLSNAGSSRYHEENAVQDRNLAVPNSSGTQIPITRTLRGTRRIARRGQPTARRMARTRRTGSRRAPSSGISSLSIQKTRRR